ncbi:MAG: tRNA (adenosine(37)-N6)-threonylcarbamoyltransferase complex ATPase subunit type 1 TsaE [Gemmataceae bacterium]
MPLSLTIEITSPHQMKALGHSLGRVFFPGCVVGLVGQLGAGKTFLTRAIAEGLDIPNSRMVSSPTFVLVQEYPARLPIYHFDAYRLNSEDEFYDLGAHEYFEGEGVCLVEWADKVEKCLPSERLAIHITNTGETSRSVEITGHGDRYELLLGKIDTPK